ncbi:MAG: HAD-superfamily hydrolase, subfamily, partial [Hyphomicrobiales bacterium]|nr:HAD-superfamily hydrolase, subfamily [Hyphomicrobiales bacterium]
MHGADALTVSGSSPRPELRKSAFFFDVDGTLLDLRARPDDVIADESLRALMMRLQDLNGGAVALVSGRSIRDLDRIFEPLLLPAAGLHGSELRFPDGGRIATTAAIMDHARPDVSRFVAGHEGLMLEDKGATLAVHFRARPDLAGDVLTFMHRFAPGDNIAVQEGKFVVELKPAAFDKGSAIKTMMTQLPFTGRVPVFYGDDLTDEAGFTFVNTIGGLSVRIGDRETPTEAREHLADTRAVRRELEALVGMGSS